MNESSARLARLLLLVVMFFPSAALLRAFDASTAALIKEGHYKRARAILASRLKTNPNDARSYEEMSKVSEAFARWDDAIQQAEKATQLDRKTAEFQAALADAIGSKLSGAQLGSFQKFSLARRFKKEAELALQLDPDNVEANQDLMEFHLDAPGILGGDKKRASELADHMVRINPVRGYLMKFEFATHEKQTGELESLLKRAMDADPKSYEAHLQAANFYLAKGRDRLPQAEEQARRVMQIAPGSVRGYTIMAAIYVQQGRWKELESLLGEAQRAVPDDLTPYYQAAKAILAGNQGQELSRAERYIRTYLGQPPEGAEPTSAEGHRQLGLILAKEGNKDQAKQELQQALALDSGFEAAKQDLKRLR